MRSIDQTDPVFPNHRAVGVLASIGVLAFALMCTPLCGNDQARAAAVIGARTVTVAQSDSSTPSTSSRDFPSTGDGTSSALTFLGGGAVGTIAGAAIGAYYQYKRDRRQREENVQDRTADRRDKAVQRVRQTLRELSQSTSALSAAALADDGERMKEHAARVLDSWQSLSSEVTAASAILGAQATITSSQKQLSVGVATIILAARAPLPERESQLVEAAVKLDRQLRSMQKVLESTRKDNRS